jgi:hypothetical protein
MTNDKLDDIRSLLEDIKGLLLVANQDKLDEMKKRLLKPGSVENQVYELCDGINTNQDIATKIQKSTDYTSAVLSNLRRKGLVRTLESEGKKVSVQVF